MWRSRMNKELHELYRVPPVMNEINSGRLRWAGHVERSMEGSLPKKIYTGKPGGRRRIGRDVWRV